MEGQMKWKQRELEFRGYTDVMTCGKLRIAGRWKYSEEQISSINGVVCISHFHLEFDVKRDYVQRVQYTGVKDINGVKIFEGDIVKEFSNIGPVEIRLVVYGTHFLRAGYPLSDMRTYEILGNVFQNPELVEKYGLEF